jgi:hypothetical protein
LAPVRQFLESFTFKSETPAKEILVALGQTLREIGIAHVGLIPMQAPFAATR